MRSENSNISKTLKNKKKITIFFLERIFMSFKKIDKCYNSNMLGTFKVVKFCSDNNIRIIYSASSSKFEMKRDEHLSIHGLKEYRIY